MTETASAPKPLTAAEKRTLDDLLARSSAGQPPAARIGEPYQALIALSLPRRGDAGRQTDLVMPGEVVHLTDEEAAAFNRHGPKDGRQVEVLRKLDGPAGNTVPRVAPRAVSGRVLQPPPPPPGSDSPRPDPPGSSAVQYAEGVIPEAAEPLPGTENAERADAVDLPPRRAPRTRGG
jgi:hypothetical protein